MTDTDKNEQLRQAVHAAAAPGELATFERTLPGRASSRDYAAKMVEAALSAEEGARARRDADHAVRDKLDLEREIRRATEQLARLEARQQIEPFNLVITNSIRKTRDRLAEMEARRASISTVDTR